MKKTMFLNEEDEKDVKEMVKSLMKRKCKPTELEETGGLGVIVESVSKDKVFFSVYKTIGMIEERK